MPIFFCVRVTFSRQPCPGDDRVSYMKYATGTKLFPGRPGEATETHPIEYRHHATATDIRPWQRQVKWHRAQCHSCLLRWYPILVFTFPRRSTTHGNQRRAAILYSLELIFRHVPGLRVTEFASPFGNVMSWNLAEPTRLAHLIRLDTFWQR